MDQNSKLSCPQCLHQNSKGTTHCDLCDWPLNQNDEVQTVAPQNISSRNTPSHEICPKSEADETVAPMNHGKQSDPNQTVAPDVLSAQKKTLQQKNTFHLAGDLAHFEIHEILGQGGMGAVYHAKDKTLHRDVAIKMLRPVLASNQLSAEALLDEARMASKLNHPNIVTIYDVARAADSNYIVMEWVDGQPLDELIPEQGLDLVTAMSYACQIADGLNSAHQKYIIHRDIKPQNIMLSADGTLKILDFGIAGLIKQQNKVASSETEGESQVKTMAVGTPSYMSPEQARGLNLDQRSDIFSFGTLLYQMLTGQRPFQGKDIPSIQQAVCEGQYKPIKQLLPALPDAVVTLLDKMLATQKDERWQSSAELAEELHRIHAELTYKKNWWQKRHWLTKAAILIPFVIGLGWSVKDVLFPASTQQLIERQLAEANKIAILPFENISGDPLIQLFGDGLAVNLGTDLATIAAEQNNTWIVPSTEISRMKDQSLKAVADKYGVNLVLTGSIQHMGSTRLLVMNLLDAVTGQQMKTAEISIQADELFQGHGLIRTQALELLDWTFPKDLTEKIKAQRPQLDGAYREYVQGRGYLYRFDQAGNADKALDAFQNAIEIDERYEAAYVGLAESQYRKYIKSEEVKWLDAMTLTVDALRNLNSNNRQINYLLAEVAVQKGAYENAIELFEKSVRFNSKHTPSQIGLAKAYYKSGKPEKAEQIYQSAKQAEPNNWRVVSGFGIYYFQVGDYAKALEQFKRLSEMSPNNDLGVRNMAAAYYALGDIDNAIEYTKRAIELNPSDRAYSNLGTMLFSIEKYEDSVVAFEKAVELNKGFYMNWGNLADAYKLVGNSKSKDSYKVAVDRINDLLKTNPNDSNAKSAAAYYLANLGNESEALFFAKQIGESNSGFENFFIATAYDCLGYVDETLMHLEVALRKNYSIQEILNSPLIKISRSDKRFKELVGSVIND
ncbi:serine/threonine-protein kinase [Marinicella rhabdoformis]|uniref:serine/threonine-protein kinase n=1 Tax=Marinicella rhabdoformis TaxID=2580566 RepID=UPI0012AEBE96|nr:serine/threonine-protein kinase [Marinicella rhabdoformis]